MIAYRQYTMVQESKQIVLSDVPFQPGQRVEVVLIAEERPAARVQELRARFKATLALPQAQAITLLVIPSSSNLKPRACQPLVIRP